MKGVWEVRGDTTQYSGIKELFALTTTPLATITVRGAAIGDDRGTIPGNLMSIYAVTSLLSMIFAVILGAFLLLRNPRHILNRLYFVVLMSVAYYSLIEFGYRISPTYDAALFFWHLDVLWPVHIAAWLHFALVFTEKTQWLKRPWLYALLYGPAAVFVLLDVLFHAVTGPPVLQPWGWSYSVANTAVSQISYLWLLLLPTICLALYIQFHRKVADARRKRQSRLMLLAGLVPLLALLLELLLNFAHMKVPPVSVPSLIFANMVVAVAIWKFELFTLTPSKAAEGIIATMTDSLVLVGLDGTIITANHATSRMLDYPEGALQGQPVSILFSHDADMPLGLLAPAAAEPLGLSANGQEAEYRMANGKSVPVSLASSRLYDDDRNLRGFVLIARDITTQREVADEISRHREQLAELVHQRTGQLQSANEKLQQEINERRRAETQNRTLQEQLHQAQKMEAIGRLAGGIAHDFNNLLLVINGYAAALLGEFETQPDVQDDVKQILEAGTRAGNLTSQLLAFSRKQIIDPVRIDANERLMTSSQMFARMIGEHIRIQFFPCDGPAAVVMDVTQLDQIIANLLVNAKDAMPRGGTITIQTEVVGNNDDTLRRRAQLPKGEYVALRIEDTGCGIPADKLQLIFEPFYTSKEVGKGTGLGLATVYGIVTQNKGAILVDSEVSEGTRFTILLPRSGPSDAAEQNDMTTGVSTRTGTETVLLVEDSPGVRRLARRQLEQAGFRVLEAADARAAVEIYSASQNDIDLLLTDVVMPEISGVQMVEQLTRDFGAPKVLFMSGHSDEMMTAYGIRKNNYAILAKPFTAEQLCTRVRDIIDGRISLLPDPPLPMA
ncbi:MAG: response regulator [Deltaproteobacteria bacterium]|nr:response regulator [Deltaproteobacteria bacterium]